MSNGRGGGREWEERLVGDPIGRRDRESASLGAVGRDGHRSAVGPVNDSAAAL
jgi:hypothetical protein